MITNMLLPTLCLLVLLVLFGAFLFCFDPPRLWWYQRYRIFLFPGKSLTFAIFGQKSSEWVKIVFFFPVPYFFSGLLNLSEWVDFKLFLKKKIRFLFFFFEKKKYTNIWKVPKKQKEQHKVPYFELFFSDIRFFFEWVACKLFQEKKVCIFFSKK